MDNKKNKFLSSFDLFNYKFSLGNYLTDSYSDRSSFYLWEKNVKNHIKNLDNVTLKASYNPSLSIVVSDMSIKNYIATSISHIHIHNKPIIKMIHCAINVTSTKAELFAICCSINQAIRSPQVKKIIVITDFLHTAKSIFDSSIHSY